jgi:hypothetical protein
VPLTPAKVPTAPRAGQIIFRTAAHAALYNPGVTSSPQPGTAAADPQVAAAVRLLHRRDSWGRMTFTSIIVFALGGGAYSSAQSQGTPPPFWFELVVIAPGALAFIGIVASIVDTVLLRRIAPEVRAQAAPVAARHPSRPHAAHYPPRHRLSWALRWVGMLIILAVAVVFVPAVVDGVGFIAGAGPKVTFDPTSYQTTCGSYGCQTGTNGILETGGPGTSAEWPGMVPLHQPFQVREPLWRWGLGASLIDGDAIAVVAILLGLALEGTAVLVLVHLAKLIRNWLRHRQQQAASAAVPVS